MQARPTNNNGTFNSPTVNGTRVDWCYEWLGNYDFAGCGDQAAAEFCKLKGYTSVCIVDGKEGFFFSFSGK